MTFEGTVARNSANAIETMLNRISELESNSYYSPISAEATIANVGGPSLAEITAEFGDPDDYLFPTFGSIIDTGNGRYWGVHTDTVNWYKFQMTLAT